MSAPEESFILTDEDGHALAVVSGGELHPVQHLPQRIPGQTLTTTPWTRMSEAELVVAVERAAETVAFYREREGVGEELLAHARRELIDIEDELIRRGFERRASS